MTIAGFRVRNHPQQTAKRGPDHAVDDRGTDQAFFDALSARFGGFTLDAAAAPHNAKCANYWTHEDDGPDAVIGPKGDRPPFGCCLLIWSR